MNKSSIISAKNLFKSYEKGKVVALNDINIDIPEGEIFGLLGPNGAGKTTFFSILCGLIMPEKGEVILNNFSLQESKDQVKEIIGVVPQEIALYPTLSGSENLKFIGRMYGLKGQDLENKVEDWLSKLGFDENRHKAVKHYSGGMKRRINLLGGILHEPKILLLDEPTVGIDVHSRVSIMEHLKSINYSMKTTIIYTSHHLEQAEKFCDRVAIIDKGTIIAQGAPNKLVEEYKSADLEEVFIKLTGKNIKG